MAAPRGSSGLAAAAAAAIAAALLALTLLAAPVGSQQRDSCGCGCSSRVVRMFTCGQQVDCCARPCQRPEQWDGSQLGADAARTQQAVEAARAAAAACANASLERDATLESGRPVRAGTPEFHHVHTAQPAGVEGFRRSTGDRCLATGVSSALVDAYNVSRREMGAHLLDLRVNSSGPNPWPTPTCDANARYRTYDGSCNNLQNPSWGQAGSQFNRLLCPRYDDGLYESPRARDGSQLPNARLVRQKVIPKPPRKWKDAHLPSLLTMQWGQMVAHDSALTSDYFGANGVGVMCCAVDDSVPSHRVPLPRNETASSCLAVDGPGRYCLSFTRSNASFVTTQNIVGPGEQDNAINSYLDLSPVYGNDDDTARSLRTFQGGLLISSGNNWLATSSNAAVDCDSRGNFSSLCFAAGDVRVNQNSQLTMLQIILLREHNRIATELAVLNPQWDDERLYQEARRILIAIFQHITYNELLPLYLGHVTAATYNLTPNSFCEYDRSGYNPAVDVTALNEFATASYRVFHGICQTELKLIDKSAGCPVGKLRLQDWMDTPVAAVEPPGRLDNLIFGLTTQPMQKPHRYITDALADHLFETDQDPGQDLTTLDIQRGRDHGLPSYCDYRRKVGGRCCRTWADLADHLSPEVISRMQTVYRQPQDVDLYVGLYLEDPQGFALTGPTAVAINLEQFWKFKYGDRFFYDFGGQLGSFTRPQLCELKKATASRLFCDNGDNITSIQPNAFLQPVFGNRPISCQKIPRVNLAAWKE